MFLRQIRYPVGLEARTTLYYYSCKVGKITSMNTLDYISGNKNLPTLRTKAP